MFEVQDLKFATLATVSRCGMVWFSTDVVSTEMVFENYFMRLRSLSLEEAEESGLAAYAKSGAAANAANAANAAQQTENTEQELDPVIQVSTCSFPFLT